ncbi:MAG: dihydroneopterin aldolase, partial [Cyclobacteriaceae bacterium]
YRIMGSIILEGLQFKAYHGYYQEEREKGNHFEVDLRVETDFSKASFDDELHGTVDYEELYRIIEEEMQHPSKLLEKVVSRIADRILSEFPVVESVEIKLAKLNPPIKGSCRSAAIIESRSRITG